ncbi:MAG: phosphate acyltransferase PlsX [Pseudomonadota bacterium]
MERLRGLSTELTLSIEMMGGDDAPKVVIDGLSSFTSKRAGLRFLLHGDEAELKPLLAAAPDLAARSEVRHTDIAVRMEDKPSQALRRAKGSSMWNAIESVKTGEAQAAFSAGNTGALMAMSMMLLRKMTGVHRPAMTAIWPTMTGTTIVLDVGANLEADAGQLITYAVMGEAYARAVTGKTKPTVGLLNVGSEDSKGHGVLKEAAALLSANNLGLDYRGFIEGNDISAGTVDVVVTDGFSGNIALKTAEGTARLVASYLREALTVGPRAKLGALMASRGLRQLRDKMNPSNVNGGVLLGLNGVVVKSHGGADAEGIETALTLAADLAGSQYKEEVAAGLARIDEASKAMDQSKASA